METNTVQITLDDPRMERILQKYRSGTPGEEITEIREPVDLEPVDLEPVDREPVKKRNPLEIKQVYKLHQLVNQRNQKQVEKLVRSGVPGLTDLTEPEQGWSALHLAVRNNDVELVHLLLSLKAHPGVQDRKGRSTLMHAAKHGNVKMIDLLIRHKAKLTMVDKKGKGLLFYCIGPTEEHKQIMQMAINKGLSVNSTSNTGKSVFMAACEQAKECEDLCMFLIEKGADVNVTDPETECSALMVAVEAESVALARAILQNGVDPNTRDKRGQTAVHIAASKGFFEMLRLLSAYSADLNVADKNQNTALHLAASEGHAETCRFLFQRGCNMTKNNEDLLPSQVAMQRQDNAALKELKEAEKILKTENVNFSSEARLHDWSFEHEAVLRQAFQLASAEETPVETVSKETFMSVLQAHHAPIDVKGLEVIVNALEKDYLCNISISEFFAGCNFLPQKFHHCSYKSAILETSESKKSEPSIPKTTCHPPPEPQVDIYEGAKYWEPKEIYINLNQCVRTDREQLLKLAFSQNIPVDTRDRMYKTPLMTACIKGKYQMAQFLISHGAEVNAYDQFKWTCLHHACMEGHADIVKLLLDHGAIIDATTKTGVTPLIRAIKSCKLNCVELLLKAGANVKAENKHEQDCMTLARLYGNKKIQKIVQIYFDKAMDSKEGKKLVQAPPKTKQVAPQKPTRKRCNIATNPNAKNYLVTLPSETVQGVPTVISTPQIKQRLAERKVQFSKPDMMKHSVGKPGEEASKKRPQK